MSNENIINQIKKETYVKHVSKKQMTVIRISVASKKDVKKMLEVCKKIQEKENNFDSILCTVSIEKKRKIRLRDSDATAYTGTKNKIF